MMMLADDITTLLAPLITYSLALIVLVVLLWLGVAWIRKQVKGEDAEKAEGFTLSDLRQLHKAGKMTDAEYERAKSLIIGAIKSPAAEKKTDRG